MGHGYSYHQFLFQAWLGFRLSFLAGLPLRTATWYQSAELLDRWSVQPCILVDDITKHLPSIFQSIVLLYKSIFSMSNMYFTITV
jgi:hypothetical protein